MRAASACTLPSKHRLPALIYISGSRNIHINIHTEPHTGSEPIMDLKQFNFIQYTEAELKQIAPLQNIFARQTELLLSLAEKTAAAKGEAAAEYLAQMQKANKELETVRAELYKINEAAEERYYKSVPTEQAILDDARKVLAVASKEDYETHQTQLYQGYTALAEYIESNKDRLSEAELERYNDIIAASASEPPEPDYSGYFAYLIGCTHLQINALKYHKLHNAPLADLIREQAAGAYKPPEQQTKPLTEQQTEAILRTTRPESLISINDAATNKIFNPIWQTKAIAKFGERTTGQLFFEEIEITTGKKGKQKVNSLVSVWYDDNITFTRNDKTIVLNDYDRAVFNAIITLYLNGTTAFTLPMLYGAITGKENSDIYLKPETKSELLAALNKLRKSEVELKFDNEAGQYTFTDESGNTLTLHRFKETIINIGEADITLNGNPVRAYVISSKPKLLSYAQAKKQIVTTPYKALELKHNAEGKTRTGLKNTPEVIALRQFLIDEIARINSPKQSSHITYDAIYSRVAFVKQIDELNKKQKLSTRQSTLAILNNFVAENYIKAYKEVTQGRAYHHIEIIPASEQS